MSFRNTRKSAAFKCVTSLPLYFIIPDVALSNCNMALPKVDFPQPDSPTSPTVSPGYTLKLTLSTALKGLVFENHPFLEN